MISPVKDVNMTSLNAVKLDTTKLMTAITLTHAEMFNQKLSMIVVCYQLCISDKAVLIGKARASLMVFPKSGS